MDDSNWLERVAARFTNWAEYYIPDAFIFALIATIIAFFMSWGITGTHISSVVNGWGKGFWQLLPFAMQMTLIIITGHVLATSPPILKFITWLSNKPKTAPGAVLLVTFLAMVTAWFNWGFSLIFSAILARKIGSRYPNPKVDYRILGAASFLGLGSVWAQGLSSSAALQMSTASAVPHFLSVVVSHGNVIPSGLIPLNYTIFLWQSFLCVAIEIIIVCFVMFLITPRGSNIKPPAAYGVDLSTQAAKSTTPKQKKSFADWLSNTPFFAIVAALLGFSYLALFVIHSKNILGSLNLNTINLTFLILGFLLHWTPKRFMESVKEATPEAWGVILQFPFYAGIAGMIVYTGLNSSIASFFVRISTHNTFPALVSIYSTFLGIFVPSGGGKWILEAPYLLAAAHHLHENLGWIVVVYNLGEAIANLLVPFWALPCLAILGLRARHVLGYTFLIFLVLLPVVLILVTTLNLTLHYPL